MTEMFTIYDKKVQAYMLPIFLRSRGEAIRQMTDTLADPNHQFAKHPEDFHLFYLGTYEEGDGSFDLVEVPVPVISCLDLMPTAEKTVKDNGGGAQLEVFGDHI